MPSDNPCDLLLISRKRKFIFVHIYKTAGESIRAALLPYALDFWQIQSAYLLRRLRIPTPDWIDPGFDEKHVCASDIMNKLGKENYDSYFSFAFVRNPWDWQVSLYNYMLKTPHHFQHELAKSFEDFDHYIRWRCSEEIRYQKDFIYSQDGELLVDFVGRFEQLDKDFQEICSHLGISARLPVLNVSNTIPYRKFYSEESRELVREAFEPDISLFGYEF